jgi:hypothetical protein
MHVMSYLYEDAVCRILYDYAPDPFQIPLIFIIVQLPGQPSLYVNVELHVCVCNSILIPPHKTTLKLDLLTL